jgi:hypothetical protein
VKKAPLGLRSLRSLALEFGVSERQLAADAARFPDHVPGRLLEGKRRYGPKAAAALRLVVRLRAAGRDEAAIATELARGPVALVPPSPAMSVSVADLATALNRRRERRQRILALMRDALSGIAAATDRHVAKVAELRSAAEAQGGDLSTLKYYDNLMARFRMELRTAERTMADVYRSAAGSAGDVRRAG